MSKRGSNNAKRFAGKNWKLSKKDTSSPDPAKLEKEQKKIEAKKNREKKKEQRILGQFDKICEKFDFEINDENKQTHNRLQKKFISIKSNKTRTQALQNVKSFKLYCKKYNESFLIEKYFDKNFHVTDFKSDFPDVYFYNVFKQKPSKVNRKSSSKNEHKLENNLDEKTLKKLRTIANKT